MSYNRNLIAKYSQAVPRYTSYPTAPHFRKDFSPLTAKYWLSSIPDNESLSLYIHIPYCDRLCWFCGCHTQHTRQYDPIRTYVDYLIQEIDLIGTHMERRPKVSALHLGGGSPSLLQARELDKLREALDRHFELSADTEISIELDPCDDNLSDLSPFIDFGLNRASIGVQDFNEDVQKIINRQQSFNVTYSLVQRLRNHGVKSINVDALYGLPLQNLDLIERNFEQIFKLSPDRLALFGYAHVPWVKPHQRMIPEDTLPDMFDRFWQSRFCAHLAQDDGYTPIGIDHYAKENDPLAKTYAQGKARRNFQGYTTDSSNYLLGLGVSSIGQFPGGYVQNLKSVQSYARSLSEGQLPIMKGVELTPVDQMRAWVIGQLMTYFFLDVSELTKRFGTLASPILQTANVRSQLDSDEIFVKTRSGFRITPRGRPFTRVVASWFDAYLDEGTARYSIAV